MKLSTQIKEVFSSESQHTTIREILDKVGLKSFGMMIIILSLPSALPVPAPGYSIPFGILLALLGFQVMILKKTPWFPDYILNRKVSTSKDKKGRSLVPSMIKFIVFFEKFLKPRKEHVFNNKFIHIILGLLVLLSGISMIIPIPLTNTIPALGVFVIGLSLVERDLLAAIVGSLVVVIGLAVTVSLITLIITFAGNVDMAVDAVKTFLKSIYS